jgi:hypothetical protein
MSLLVHVEVTDGSGIEETAEAMTRMANALLCHVQADFNGCMLLAGAGGTADTMVIRYRQSCLTQSKQRVVSNFRKPEDR